MRVRGLDVIAFREVVRRELPVRAHVDLDLIDAHELFHGISLEQARERFEELVKVRAVVRHRVPDEAAPCVDAHLLQADFAAGVAARKVLRVRHVRKAAVLLPHPSVIRAGDPLDRGGCLHQPDRTVAAGIVEPPQRSVLLPHDDDGLIHEVVNDVIARIGQFVLAPGDVPDAGPEVVPFLLRPLLREITLGINGIAAQVRGILAVHRQGRSEDLGHRRVLVGWLDTA